MQNMKICLDNKSYYSKPKDGEIGKISKRISGQTVKLDSENIISFVGDIGLDGCTFCPATFKGGERKKDNFEQMQLFVLDFDNDNPDNTISFEDVKSRAERYNLPILFAYESFNSKNKDRFRVVFQNDVPITTIRNAEVIQNSLLTMFPEADLKCKNIVQMYFGGNKSEILYIDEDTPTINILSTIVGMTNYLEDRYGKTNYHRKVAEFTKANHLAVNDRGMPDISIIEDISTLEKNAEIDGATLDNKISPNSTIENRFSIIEGFGEKLLKRNYLIRYDNSTSISAAKRTSKNHAEYRSSVLVDVRKSCQLFSEFESGTRRLNHEQLFGLATNLTKIETGTKVFMDIFRNNACADDRIKKISYWEHQLRRYIVNFKPQSCEGFCPYKEHCSHGTNILYTSKLKYHQIEKLTNYKETFVSVDEAFEDMQHHLLKAVAANRPMWYIIKAQTAIGKTQAYLDLLRNTSKRVLIVVPTNKLKTELERHRAKGIDIIASPSLHEIKDELPDHIWAHIEKLYNSGKSVIPYIKKVISEEDPESSALLKQYLKELDEFKKFDGHAITTHRRLLTMDVSKYDFVIVDEDIIFDTIIPNKTEIAISDLKKVRKRVPANSQLARKINSVLKYINANGFFTLQKISYDEVYDDGKPMGVDIPSFCSATHFCYYKDSDNDNRNNQQEDFISFMNPVKFNKEVKYIMLSATVDENICKYYFGETNVNFYECKKARLNGSINQYYNRTMSRMDISKDPAIISFVKKWSGFKHTISFKKFMKYYRGDLHFGNCAGCDYMNGEDIDIIGTPHQPERIYKLFAYSLGLDVDLEEVIKPNVTVDHNGWRFRFTTYDNEILRAIQFYMIKSQLEQAVGRARLLRKDCIVNLFSNFPLSQANLKVFDYDKDTVEYGLMD